MKEFKEKAQQCEAQKQVNAELKQYVYPRVLFLGTGSAMPSDTRSITSILVSGSESKSLLLDCGEYTIGQLSKYFGPHNLDAELVKIKGLSISHCHLDHLSGMYGVIQARQLAFKRLGMKYEKLVLIIPNTIAHMILVAPKYIFESTEDFINDLVECVPVELLLYDEKQRKDEIEKNRFVARFCNVDIKSIFESLGVLSLKSVMVTHIESSYAVCLNLKIEDNNSTEQSSTSSNGSKEFKLVFSGDCRPSDELAFVGKGCDLLIHECTFDNTEQEKAKKVNHSTIGEALEVSRRMGAKHTLLTHLSQRYSKFVFTDDIDMDNCTFAFDFMCVTPHNMNLLSKETNEKLSVIFKEKILEYEKTLTFKQTRNYSKEISRIK